MLTVDLIRVIQDGEWTLRIRRRSGSSEALGGGTPDHRPHGRGFGPFTGGQLTAIILGVVFAIACPVGAWAVTGSSVFVTDAHMGYSAKVDAKRNLSAAIHDATTGGAASVDAKNNLNTAIHDPSTGTGAKVDASGNLQATIKGTVDVTGSVESAPAKAGDTFSEDAFGSTDPGTCVLLAGPPSGLAAVITSVQFVELDRTTTSLWSDSELGAINMSSGTNIPCNGALYQLTARISRAEFDGAGQSSEQFPSGLGIRPGHGLVMTTSGANAMVQVFVRGYYVDAADCGTSCY